MAVSPRRPRARAAAPSGVAGGPSDALRSREDPPEGSAAAAHIAAMDRQTAVWAALGDKLDAAIDRFGPAADALHGLAGAQDKLCKWLKGAKPWIWAAVLLVLNRTINAAPEDVPKLLAAVAQLAKLAGGQP